MAQIAKPKQMLALPDDELGALVRHWHDANYPAWDAWEPEERMILRRVFKDIQIHGIEQGRIDANKKDVK